MRAAGNERTVEFPAAFYFTKQVLLLTKNLFSFIMISQLTDQSVGKIQLKRKQNGGGYDIKIQCEKAVYGDSYSCAGYHSWCCLIYKDEYGLTAKYGFALCNCYDYLPRGKS